jgi:hypothetical protein
VGYSNWTSPNADEAWQESGTAEAFCLTGTSLPLVLVFISGHIQARCYKLVDYIPKENNIERAVMVMDCMPAAK